MDKLRSAWESLYQPGQHTMFQCFAWNRLAASHFFDREAPFVSFFEDDNGTAIVPAAITDRSRVTLLGERLFDYRDVLNLGDPSALVEAWRPVAELGFPLSVTAVRGLSSERWNFAGLSPFCAAPCVRRTDASAEILEASHRKLGRLSRRLRKQGLELRTHDGGCGDLLTHIYRQKANQFRGHADNVFADSARSGFIVAVSAMDPDFCQIYTYEQGSRTVAALVTFRDHYVCRFYTVWFDSAWARESPGQVLVYEATLEDLRAGLDCDFMTGEQPHKTRLATSAEPLYRVELPAGGLSEAIERITLPAVKAA